jgi:primosomal protein N' (replication factor Y)
VVIQTFHPEHYGIQAALHNDDAAFAEQEMRFRRIFHYPPFSRMVQILARDASRDRAAGALRDLASTLRADPEARGVRILGPAPAPFERLRGQWRFQLLLRGDSSARLRSLVRRALPESPRVDLVVDVDPHELL